MSTDIYVASLVILYWTVIFTVAIAAFIVAIDMIAVTYGDLGIFP